MDKPVLSPAFNMEDIRKLRDYNSSRHAAMTVGEIRKDLRPSVEAFEKLMGERRGARKAESV